MQQTERIVAEICKSFIGNVPVVRKILLVMLAGGHVLLEDIPGVGKTTLALALSNALALKHNRVQFTPDVMPTDITGFSMPRGGQLVYQPGAALCNLLLADELNRAPSRTQAALLECMEEQQVTVDGATHPLPQPFMVIATQNPSGSAGTQLLPESQMDRFMMRLSIGYPALEGELEMLRRKHGEAGSEAVQPVASAADLIAMREAASRVYLADELYQYILSLTRATREHTDIRQGVSPRGSVAVMALAQAAALMNGRDYTLPGDVKAVFVDATAHRLLLGPGVRSQTNAAQALLSGILDKVPAPTVRKRQ
ncbi:MoxR family ATPase [Ruminococcaceae bacterium OttesenSCG-928-D13]|nr:MoxR family ATPase [Ruminococcaceae bacterium OttesenSCG-928-D13]